MKTNNEMIKQHIEELQQLVNGTKAGLVVAYTSPESEGTTQVLSVGGSMSQAANYLAIQDALTRDAESSVGCDCAGCSALRGIAAGEISYDDYMKSEEKPTHTFVIETPEDFKNALNSIFKGEI
ncbi:TPA: hypothetical protein ACGBG5_003271 [Enterococcus faecalis]